MDNVIYFMMRHIKAIIAGIVILILVAWAVSFFLTNSLVFVTVSAENTQLKTATLTLDDLNPEDITIGDSVMKVIPKNTTYITASSDEYSTIQPLVLPPILGSLDITLKKHFKTNLVSTADTDCVYEKPSFTMSWKCNQLTVDVKKTSYQDSAYPRQSFIDIEKSDLEYATRYKDGFLASSGFESLSINYVDLSSGSPDVSSVPINTKSFSSDYTLVLVDEVDVNSFIVFDQKSRAYAYFENGIDSTPRTGTLPAEFAANEEMAVTISFEGGVLSRYSGPSSNDVDNHTDEAADPSNKQAVIARYTLANTSLVTTKLKDLQCFNAVISDDIVACQDRDIVTFYTASDLTNEVMKIANASEIFQFDNEIYVVQDASIYRYDAADRNLYAVLKIKDRSIADTYVFGGTIYTSVWYTYPDSRQSRLLYSIDSSTRQDNSALISNYPVTISDELIYGIDIKDDTIYVMLVENNSENQASVRTILKENNLLNSKKILFF